MIPLAFDPMYIHDTLERCTQECKKSTMKRIWKKLVKKFEPKVDDQIMLHFRWVKPKPQPVRVQGIRCSENHAFISKNKRFGYSVKKTDKRDQEDKFYIYDKISVYQVREPEAPVFDLTARGRDQPTKNNPFSDGNQRTTSTPLDQTFEKNQAIIRTQSSNGNRRITPVIDDDQILHENMPHTQMFDKKEVATRDYQITLSANNYISNDDRRLSPKYDKEKSVITPHSLIETRHGDPEPLTTLHQYPTYDEEPTDKSLIGIFDGNRETFDDKYPTFDEEATDESLIGIFDGNRETFDKYPTYDAEPRDPGVRKIFEKYHTYEAESGDPGVRRTFEKYHVYDAGSGF